MTGLVVRPATAADARAIAEVHVATWRDAYAHVLPREVLDALDVDERERIWKDIVTAGETPTFVGVLGAEIVGFASVGASRDEDAPGEGELYAIYVRPDAWGTGVGRALMAEARAWLAARYPAATLWVLADNPRARRFYEREGWQPDRGRTDVVRGVEVEEIRYRLSLLGPG